MPEQAADRRASEFNHEGHDGIRGKPPKVPLRVTSWPLWFMKLGHHRQKRGDPGSQAEPEEPEMGRTGVWLAEAGFDAANFALLDS